MRFILAIAMATLTLGLASRPMHGRMPAADAMALETIDMVDGQIGWAVTDRQHIGAFLRTADGGNHWTDVTPLGSSGQKIKVSGINVLSSSTAWVIGNESLRRADGTTDVSTIEIFRTVDGGHTWTRAATPASVFVALVSFINSREGWFVAPVAVHRGYHEVEIYHSTNGGETWLKVASATRADASGGLPADGGKTAITFLSPTTGWITGLTLEPGRLYVYVTRNGGRTWQQINIAVPRGLPPNWTSFPQPPKFFTVQDGVLPVVYVLLNDSLENVAKMIVFYMTHDSGVTWMYNVPVSVNISEENRHAVADMNHLWVTHGSVLRATTDGGRRWATIRQSPILVGVRQVDFISPQVGWMIRQTSPFLLKTLDGGRSWTTITYTITR